jgi:hypothetical protein
MPLSLQNRVLSGFQYRADRSRMAALDSGGKKGTSDRAHLAVDRTEMVATVVYRVPAEPVKGRSPV